MMRVLIGAGALLLLGHKAAAQGYSTYILPKIITYKSGSYQLPDGTWHNARLYTESGDKLKVQVPGEKRKTEYVPGDVVSFVIEADTFGLVQNFDVSNRRSVSKAFGKQLHRTPYHVLYVYQEPPGENGISGYHTLVQAPDKAAVRVPKGRGAFTEAMLPLFGDCPEAAKGITAGKLGPQHVKQLMHLYARWAQKNQTTGHSSTQPE